MKQHGIRLFLALNAALAALLAWLWLGPDGAPRHLRWEPPAPMAPELGEAAAPLPQVEAVDTALFIATLDRPLFSPSRRPAPVAPPAGAAPKEEAPDPLAGIQLYGLYATEEGGGILARVQGKVRRIAVNESLGGWTLKSIQEREAVLVRDGEERRLPLAISRPAATGRAGAPAAAGAGGPGNGPAAPGASEASAAAPSAPAAPAAGASAVGAAEERRQQLEEARRELQRRRNELRAKAGAKPISP